MRVIPGIVICTLILLVISCNSTNGEQASEKEAAVEIDQAQSLVDEMIAYHGGEAYPQSNISFTFRGRAYTALKGESGFQYTREYVDKEDRSISDKLTGEGFMRKKDGEEEALSAKDSAKYANSLNSVVYFAYLPYGLNDPAVNKEYVGQATLNDQKLNKVKVTFQQEGGGKDFDDTYVYWLDAETHQLMYLAYEFHVDDGGLRFRVANNVRRVGEILFADYINYKAELGQFSVFELDKAFEEGKLDSLSEIRLENVEVN
ncbi:MAG: DUF6503 family protein [Bacteroidota bacterium]